MTKNQIAMRNIARGTGDTMDSKTGKRILGRSSLKPACRQRLDEKPEFTHKKWCALDAKRTARWQHNRNGSIEAERKRVAQINQEEIARRKAQTAA